MTELYMCVSSMVAFLAWHPVHLFHCCNSLFTLEVGRSSTGSFPAVLSPLGVVFYCHMAIFHIIWQGSLSSIRYGYYKVWCLLTYSNGWSFLGVYKLSKLRSLIVCTFIEYCYITRNRMQNQKIKCYYKPECKPKWKYTYW
jgi:hypothetical protein